MSSPSLTRRALVAGLAAAPLLAALPRAWASSTAAAPASSLEFDILRKDAQIGSHYVTLEPTGDGLQVAIETEIAVKVLGITAYRYRHEAREDWSRQDGGLRLTRLLTHTDDDGRRFEVSGATAGDSFRVEGSAGSLEAPASVVPSSYWTPLVLARGELLSTKSGELFPVAVERLGREAVESAGETVEAERYRIDASPKVSLWFDDRRQVRRMAFETRGEFIDYRLRRMTDLGLDERVF